VNFARDETSPADALRDYFMILEDVLGRDEPSIADLKHTRDFVESRNRALPTESNLDPDFGDRVGNLVGSAEPSSRRNYRIAARYISAR
jgi:hypothetical protein